MSPSIEDRVPGRIITFYSYKGGTGRSMALANIAFLLARGLISDSAQTATPTRRVLVIDWDLEAPGLHRYFGPFLSAEKIRSREAYDREHPGLIELFGELDKATEGHTSRGPDEDAKLMTSVFEEVGLADRFSVATSVPDLSFMKAGRFDREYPHRVSNFRWDLLYDRIPSLIPTLAGYLSERFDYVLIDSRTGITDTSGICTMLLPELLVLVFTPNLQSVSGVITLIHEATEYRKQSADLRPLVVFPLPSRIEPAKPKLLEQWRMGFGTPGFPGFQSEFESACKEAYALDRCDLTAYFDEVQIQHVPDYAYGEQIAVAVEDTDSRLSLRRSYESFARRLVGLASPWIDPRTAAAESQILELCQLGAAELGKGQTKRAQRHLSNALDSYLETESFPAPELADGLFRLGTLSLEEGDLSTAETVLREAVQVAERGFGSDDLRVADYLERLGDALTAAGKTQEALKLTTRALDLRRAAVGPRHPAIADLDDKLGALLAQVGRLEESRSYFQQSLDARREILGPDHPALASNLERLADTATAMGSLREAEEYLNEALSIGASAGPEVRARILGRLGSLSLRKRDLSAAEGYFESAIKSSDPNSQDPATADWLDGLAQVAIANGDFDKAQSCYERAQLTREAALGPSHPDTLRSVVNLGDLAAAQGKWERADTNYRRVIHLVGRTVGGEAHPLAGEVYRKLGTVAQNRGDYHEAESLYRHALDINQKLGDEAGTSSAYRQLGTLAWARGDYDTAESLFRQSLEIKARMGDQAGVAADVYQLGALAQLRENYDTAESFYREALSISERLGDEASMSFGYRQLGALAQARDDYDTAESLYRHVLDISERLGDQAALAGAYHQLGLLAQDRRDYDGAESFYREALGISERLGDQPAISGGYHQLGILAQERGHFTEAESRYRQSLAIDERLGDRVGMAISYSALADLSETLGNPGDALAYRLRALALRLAIGSPSTVDLRAVIQLRDGVGHDRFRSIVATTLDEASASSLIAALDTYEAAKQKGASPAKEDPAG
jgi:tetratricopeptide (TPR) repeat protein/cellulose biosynthesis protein BcsQ